jgi:hypothetical protein
MFWTNFWLFWIMVALVWIWDEMRKARRGDKL